MAFVYVLLGVASGNSAANDGRWAAAFLSNFHFEAVGTNYFTASLPPSPLQNFWSLSVEEQFYVVYPTLFLIVASVKSRISLRTRLTFVLGITIAASYWWSVVQTGSNPSAAYFSPLYPGMGVGPGRAHRREYPPPEGAPAPCGCCPVVGRHRGNTHRGVRV